MKYNLIEFPKKGEVLVKYETDYESIIIVIHSNLSKLWTNSLCTSLKPAHLMVYYKNKFDYNSDNNNMGRWILNDLGMINKTFDIIQNNNNSKDSLFNTISDVSFFDTSKIDIEKNYDYFILECKNRILNRTLEFKCLGDFENKLIITDKFKGTKEFDFYVDVSYPHISYDKNSTKISENFKALRGYNKHIKLRSKKIMKTIIDFKHEVS